ncbi:hypothetical protein Dtox_2518 [Desulfofarcimen acetoxidans DSM 771]|jgi:hypothetical protein|uniref:Uncharacterized protein n=1 Tax=Desulfofarcimen acetoxidans (strain ATCC 49208 / DSM 771 / KCTC 5769 / VKM B-1644 / 5575) TaxID=485916 RepID=C8W0R7_DESAS|nr:hypothetical protein Dtox_2518 [Desulfofarcimen acetoxidans DSM 771]
MWNKYQSHFVLVKVRHGVWKFIFPVPLFIFDDLLKSVLDLVVLGECFTSRLKLLRMSISMVLQLLYEIRQLGRWQMADITFCKNQISISFY